MTDYHITRDFRASEFRCKHCGAAGIRHELVEHLQSLRDSLGAPVIVTSGYRCPLHPVEARKTKPGRHTEGIAADIRCSRVSLRQIYLRVLRDFPAFRGIGVAPALNFVHLDIRKIKPGQRAVVWAYDDDGKEVKWDGRWENLPKKEIA